MYYYEIWVGSSKFQGNSPLTYSSDERLQVGQVVSVPLRNKATMGFVARETRANKALAPKIKSVLDATATTVPNENLRLHEWMLEYYPASGGATSNLFLPPELPTSKDTTIISHKDISVSDLPALTADQAQALEKIRDQNSGTILLHGETGSGKTRIYIELANDAISHGKSVVILTPEIGLTPQLLRSFEDIFQNRVLILHSNLTTAQRRNAWYQIVTATEPLIVIGPRSALFAPLKHIGLIVVDEAHESTYKQEQAPYYHATRVASQLARFHSARCILGSATPLVQDAYIFQEKQMPVIRMRELATGEKVEPKIAVVDMKDRNQIKKSPILSNQLLEEIEQYTSNGQQALLFLNRRGSARMILCQNCGWQAVCNRCDIALTYHADQHLLRCHTCGLTEPVVHSCPECHSTEVVYTSPGTKSLEEEAKRLFPSLKIQRFDSDNLADEKLEKHFAKLQDGSIDIIVGTQLVTKGLDLPHLGLVGVINADSGLAFPDFTAEEKTYQQLRQVLGRVGRHQKSTSVVIQTYNPDNPLLTTVINRDWQGFLQSQLEERQLFGFPPFMHMLQLKVARASRTSAQTSGHKLVELIQENIPGVAIRGPSPQLHEKVNNSYNWQVIVSSKQRSRLLKVIEILPSGWHHNIDPVDLM